MENGKNVVVDKSFSFAVRIYKLYRFLCEEKREFVLSKQMLRSGTSIGANVSEAQHGQSKKDFINKMSIALKEANETQYWLKLLNATAVLPDADFEPIHNSCNELISLLVAIIRTSKSTP